MKETERRPKVTLEDLLQLKRAERPPAEFWPEFERTLRAKQLAAIVETRPWWRNWSARKTLVRVCVPLGATALVAMTFGSIREFRSHVVPVQEEQVARVTQNGVEATVSPVGENKEVGNGYRGQSGPVPATTEVAAMTAVNAPAPMPETRALQVAEAKSDSSTDFLARAFSPNPVMQVLSEPTLVQMVGRAISVSSLPAPSRTAMVEPLAQVATPRDNRRARLLAYSVSFDPHAADSSDAVRSRERITHRLSDEAIYDSITRLGLSGDRVSIKF
jgi:hypothetical protein